MGLFLGSRRALAARPFLRLAAPEVFPQSRRGALGAPFRLPFTVFLARHSPSDSRASPRPATLDIGRVIGYLPRSDAAVAQW
jgi:hypothetical protein